MVEDAQTAPEAADGAAMPTAPLYGFDDEPRHFAHIDVAELESEVSGNFFRSAKWSVSLFIAPGSLLTVM